MSTTGFACRMCGQCCRRYLIPVSVADIRRISFFAGLEPREFLELITPDESVTHTYNGVPRITLNDERDNVLVLREENDGCMFLRDRKCSVYQARPLRCRPFPLSYERKEGEVVFQINEEALEFCKGLGGEARSVDFEGLTNVALAMEKEQRTFRERIRIWNSIASEQNLATRSMDDLLKFLIPHSRNTQAKPRRLSA